MSRGRQRHGLGRGKLLGTLTHLATLALQAAGALFPARGGVGGRWWGEESCVHKAWESNNREAQRQEPPGLGQEFKV